MSPRFFASLVLAGCGSSPPAPAPLPPTLVPVDAAVPDALDAGPSAALLAAPAWIFRFNAPPRLETWTLRTADGEAALDVESSAGTLHYLGTAVPKADEPTTLVVTVATRSAQLALTCKPATRGIGPQCTTKRPPKLDVLDCYHPDFAEPMTFAPAPGVEFIACGYRRLP